MIPFSIHDTIKQLRGTVVNQLKKKTKNMKITVDYFKKVWIESRVDQPDGRFANI